MAERHLDLFELRPALVRQPGIRAPKIVGCEIRQSKLSRIFPQYRPDAFPSQGLMGDPSASINWPEDPAYVDCRSRTPVINSEFRPGRHWNGADPAVFADQIDNHPAPLALLDVVESKRRGFGTSQPATDQDRQQRAIAFSSHR